MDYFFPPGDSLFSYFFGFGAQRCPKKGPKGAQGRPKGSKNDDLGVKKVPQGRPKGSKSYAFRVK